MEFRLILGFLFLFVDSSYQLYDSGDDVVILTSSNFPKVIESEELWLVEFYAPWCGHCKSLAPEWKNAARNLKGVVNVGAVDCDEHKDLASQYSVQGFPTIKIFGYNKKKPKDYQGGRTADAITDEAMKQLRVMVNDKRKGPTDDRDDNRGGGSDENAVVTLTDANFEELVLNSKESWLVEFYAPWCGHCKNLEPKWKEAASQVKAYTNGGVKLGALDATQHTSTASKYGIRGYPTIKVFKQGFKSSPEDYQGGRETGDIITFAKELHVENIEPPSVDEVVSQESINEACDQNTFCIISFLPHILDAGASSRNRDLDMLRKLGEKFKKHKWGWLWVEGGKHFDLEKALDVGGFGYPAVAAVNSRKEMFTLMTAAFNEGSMTSFLNGLSYGRGGRQTHSLKGGKMPDIKSSEPWDGQDGQMPDSDYDDLGDFSWDDEETDKKDEL